MTSHHSVSESAPSSRSAWLEGFLKVAPLMVLAVALGLSVLSINNQPPTKDAAEYSRLGHFWATEGVFSNGDRDGAGGFAPSMIREPGLPAYFALAMILGGVDTPAAECSEYDASGELVRSSWATNVEDCDHAVMMTRWANVINLVAIGALAFYGSRLVMPSRVYRLAFLCIIVLGAYYGAQLNSNYSEILSATLMLATALATHAALFAPRWRWVWAVVGGLCLLALILTKSVFFYAGPFVLLFGLLRAWRARRVADLGRIALLCCVGYAGVFLWIDRNDTYFGVAAITDDRNVLAVRAEYNGMTWGEWRSGWVRYSPFLRVNSVGSLGPDDTQSNMSRTNQEGYYQRAIQQRGRAVEATGLPDPSVDQIRSAAMRLILDHPGEHLVATPLFAYRGIFVDFGRGYPAVRDMSWGAAELQGRVSAALAWIAIILSIGLFLRGMIVGDWEVLAILLLPAFSFAIYSGVSHYIPRYTEPSIPCFLLAMLLALSRLRNLP